MFHKEGKHIIIVSILLCVGVIVLSCSYLSNFVLCLLALLILSCLVFILWFFRNPKRITISEDGEIIAPVDGKVVVIEEAKTLEYFKEGEDKRIQVSVFMSPFNIHVCRYPLSGIVNYTKYHPGRFLVAWHPKSSTENERTTIVVENNGVEVLFRQVAGALARRIVMYPKKGTEAKVGTDFGFIKFGSRVDVFLPLDTEILVDLHQKVEGGLTKIGRLK